MGHSQYGVQCFDKKYLVISSHVETWLEFIEIKHQSFNALPEKFGYSALETEVWSELCFIFQVININ